jgi:hypothetical protein
LEGVRVKDPTDIEGIGVRTMPTPEAGSGVPFKSFSMYPETSPSGLAPVMVT